MKTKITKKFIPLIKNCLTIIIVFATAAFAQNQIINAQTTPANRDALQAAINSAITSVSSPNAITIGNITIGNTEHAIIIGASGAKPNLTIQGSTGSNFYNNIDQIVNKILSNGATNVISDFTQFAPNFNTSSLTFISGNGTHKPTLNPGAFFTQYKWFSTSDLDPSYGNGLGFKNILFKDVTISYDSTPTGGERKFVNGLIGNSYKAGSLNANQLIPGSPGVYGTSLGKITGNEFLNIDIILKGDKDTNYLAGGGIIGVRDTGELALGSKTPGQHPLSAEMDIVSGNYFNKINVTTTEGNNTTLQSNLTKSAYIEGGGIIGVNGVSSPDTSIGHALLKGLTNNAFTDIHVLSNDVLLGGGIVGVNNNSKDESGSAWNIETYAQMDNVTGNIFGNGTDGDIKVDVGYSLRGGGVIGLNGLSSAGVELSKLDRNVFAGIRVTAGTYIKGGGIVGLQNNDNDYKKEGIDTSVSGFNFTSAPVTAKTISNNAFVNLEVLIDKDSNVTNGSQYLQGGGIIGLRSNMGAVSLNNLNNNIFKDIEIKINNATSTNEGLFGGGIVGVNSQGGYASIESASGNYFDDVDVIVDGTILGSGVIGAANMGTSYAKIGNVTKNIFSNINVKTTNIANVINSGNLDGGGVIGIYSQSGENMLNNVTENKFYGTNNKDIEIFGAINGGGVIGVNVEGTGSASFLPNVSGNLIQDFDVKGNAIIGGGIIGVSAKSITTNIGSFAKNTLTGNTVTSTTDITGGGIIGVYVQTGAASISSLTENNFTNSNVTTGTTNSITGGGIIGVKTNAGLASIISLTGNNFTNSNVTTQTLKGGGIIGVEATDGYALIGELTNNVFVSGTIKVNENLEGGGIIGVRANTNDYASIASITNTQFSSVNVTVAGDLQGGGIIGVRANTGAASIDKISGLKAAGTFLQNTVKAETLEGGGIIGVRSDNGNATIGSITDANFNLHEISTTTNHIQGGGIIGVRSDSLAKINSIANTIFEFNTVTSAKWIDGGGIIGASGSAKSDTVTPHGGIGLIDGVVILGNNITATDGQIMGGLIYSYGAAGGMTIKDSFIGANKFYSTVSSPGYTIDSSYTNGQYAAKVYGAITIDTGATLYNSDKEHVVTVTSTAKKQQDATIFYQNAIHENGQSDRYNSFYFGTMPYVDVTDSNKVKADYAAADARLVVASSASGIVLLLDPIVVSQQNATGNNYTFNMDVGRQDGATSGLLIWAGENKFDLLKQDGSSDDANSGSITMLAGSTTTLVDKNSSTTLINYGEEWSEGEYSEVSTMQLIAPNYSVKLNKGAWLNVEGHNYWDLSKSNDNSTVNFNGDLHFNLNNTNYYDNKTTPDSYTSDPNSSKIPLLTIKTPDKDNVIDLSGATVHLQNFLGDKELVGGDRFYLIDAIDSDANNQTKFANADKLANEKDADGNFIAYARQGLLRGYNFIIDLNGEHDDASLINSHYLTARLPLSKGVPVTPTPAKELVPPAEGRVTGVSFLGHLSLPNLYEIDPQCDPCGDCDSVCNWTTTPFASIRGDWYSVDTGGGSNFDVRGSVFQVGLAFQRKSSCSRLFWGVFFDSGCADYDTYNYIPEVVRSPDFRGDGELTATGGGIFVKRYIKGGWRFDGIVRGGNLRNEYYNPDVNIHDTNFEMRYDIDSAYVGVDLGLMRQWKIGKRRLFDLYGRYGWTYMAGDTITWNYETDDNKSKYSETVRFDEINSHRIRLGARFTQRRDVKLSWYWGGGYEYEFDGKAKGYAIGVGSFDGTALRGGYGIGEIGLIYKKGDKFQLNAGLTGYAGNQKGGNIDFAATWKW
ncbi:MAG: hypothetical protein LBP59_09395 [Planctomycetaceae bacterium]|jgi:hypothetical protein|nr:hypothetical protein [Planctomycetaceae bacterium]